MPSSFSMILRQLIQIPLPLLYGVKFPTLIETTDVKSHPPKAHQLVKCLGYALGGGGMMYLFDTLQVTSSDTSAGDCAP